ncbi:MAG TPA: nucleotidyltransferase domain-containing protein [Tepidisphaeraceae bacterium]|jgi:predicted nucleotidyltransferase
MASAREIFWVVDEIVRQLAPEKVILFGSYAYGAPNEDSDVDFMIVTRYRGDSYAKASQLKIPMDRYFPMDVLVRSPAEMRRRAAMKDWFIIDILEQGIVLHDQDDARVGGKGRSRLRRRLAAAKVAKPQAV